jgi:hypothetical protein
MFYTGKAVSRDPFPAAKVHVPPDLERLLGERLAQVPRAERAAYARGFRAAWHVCAAVFTPYVRQWEARWWSQVDEIHALRARVGELLSRLSRFEDPG